MVCVILGVIILFTADVSAGLFRPHTASICVGKLNDSYVHSPDGATQPETPACPPSAYRLAQTRSRSSSLKCWLPDKLITVDYQVKMALTFTYQSQRFTNKFNRLKLNIKRIVCRRYRPPTDGMTMTIFTWFRSAIAKVSCI